MKPCSICKEPLPLEMFSKSSKKKDGLRSECKECQKTVRLERLETATRPYRERVLAILKAHGEPMWIGDLRKCFLTDRETTSAVTSAIRALDDRGEIRISGGCDRSSKRMLEVIKKAELPMTGLPRVVHSSNDRHWDSPLTRPRYGVSGSTLGDFLAAL